MEFRVLRYFLEVAREENISAAAERLHVTQPTLSRQLMDLEAELGKALFNREHRRISLTYEGMLLRKRAEGIRLVARTAKQLRDEGYDIHFHLFSAHDLSVSQRLDKGLLDFGIFAEGANLHKYDSIRIPYADTWGVLMRRDSPLAAKECIEPKDLWTAPLIVSLQADTNNELSGWLMRDRDRLNIVGTYNLLFNASIMVEEGLGYALCFDKIIKTKNNDVLCFRPLKPARTAKLDIVWKKYQVFSKPAELFLKKLQENFEQ